MTEDQLLHAKIIQHLLPRHACSVFQDTFSGQPWAQHTSVTANTKCPHIDGDTRMSTNRTDGRHQRQQQQLARCPRRQQYRPPVARFHVPRAGNNVRRLHTCPHPRVDILRFGDRPCQSNEVIAHTHSDGHTCMRCDVTRGDVKIWTQVSKCVQPSIFAYRCYEGQLHCEVSGFGSTEDNRCACMHACTCVCVRVYVCVRAP